MQQGLRRRDHAQQGRPAATGAARVRTRPVRHRRPHLLYNAGPNLTQKSAIKAFEALPYLDSVAAKGSPPPRPTQIINHVPTKVQYAQVQNKAEYPCAHPTLPPDEANYRICLVPQAGYDKGGKAIKGAYFVDKS